MDCNILTQGGKEDKEKETESESESSEEESESDESEKETTTKVEDKEAKKEPSPKVSDLNHKSTVPLILLLNNIAKNSCFYYQYQRRANFSLFTVNCGLNQL